MGGAGNEKSSAAVIEGGNGVLSLHVDAFQRRTEDLKIPGYARSARLRASDPANHRERAAVCPIAMDKSDGGAIGAALNFDRGYAGLSYSTYASDYGTVAEEDVRIHMKSERMDFAGELRELGPIIEKVKLRYAHTDYQHRGAGRRRCRHALPHQGRRGLHRGDARQNRLAVRRAWRAVPQCRFQSAQGEEALLPSIKTNFRRRISV